MELRIDRIPLVARVTAPWPVQSILLLLGTAALSRILFNVGRLELDAYRHPVILVSALRDPIFALFFALGALAVAIGWRQIEWKQLENGRVLRIFVFTSSLASAWTFSLYDFNAYYGQTHFFDRIFMLSMALLTLRHPSFALFYLFESIAVVSQLHQPIPGFNWLDKRILFDVLICFSVFVLLRSHIRIQTRVFFVIMLGLVGTDYVIPGIAKLRLQGWFQTDDLRYLAFATWHNGWLWGVGEERLLRLLATGSVVNKILLGATLVGELGFLFVLARRWVFRSLFLFSFGLHVGIYVSSGILFWKWMLLNLLVLVLFERIRAEDRAWLFRPRVAAFTAAVMLAVPLVIPVSWLAWFDTPLSQVFRFEVVGRSGTTYALPRLFMQPYGLLFAQNRFFYLLDEPHLVGTFGATMDRDLYDRIRTAKSREEIDELERQFGRSDFDPTLAARFDQFMIRYFQTLNERGVKRAWYSNFRAPPHIWSRPRRSPRYDMQEPAARIRVYYHRALYHDGSIIRWEPKLIRDIEIPMGERESG